MGMPAKDNKVLSQHQNPKRGKLCMRNVYNKKIKKKRMR
jgi:hypothetical protein